MIEIIDGKVNLDGELKEVGAVLKLNKSEEQRLVNLGFAKIVDKSEGKGAKDNEGNE